MTPIPPLKAKHSKLWWAFWGAVTLVAGLALLIEHRYFQVGFTLFLGLLACSRFRR